jgi:ABC-2 type transport system ATP-binding protein
VRDRQHETSGSAAAVPDLVDLRDVTRDFGRFRAVDQVSLTVGPGEIVGLLGANGAGKTTLLKILLGLLRPTSGSVEVLGGTPDRDIRRRIGYVPQSMGLYDDLTVAENVEFIAGCYDVPPPDLPAGLLEIADRPVRSIGLGRQRRLAFVAALGHHPDLVVLDEPTSGVDPLARARLWDTIRTEADRGAGVLVTTHYMQEAEQCDRLVLMVAGKAVASGSERDVIGGTTAVQVRCDPWQSTFDVLADAGLPVVLDGTGVRVADVPVDRVTDVLARAGLSGEVQEVPATLEEALTASTRA